MDYKTKENMNELKLTPIDQIEDMADGIPVLAVEGTVKLALDVTTGTSTKGHPWSKQFFVLASETAEIACSMWDATGNEVTKGERIHIENTQNKKGEWKGMVKGSYQKNGERKHTLEIRAEQVKITDMDKRNNATAGEIHHGTTGPQLTEDWPEAEKPKDKPITRPFNTMLDERQRAIIRQHSQSMALEVLKLKVTLNELTVEDLTPAKLRTLADYFDNDVIGAAQ